MPRSGDWRSQELPTVSHDRNNSRSGMPIQSSSSSPVHPAAPDLPKFSREVSVMAWIEDAYGNFLMVRQAQGKKLWTLPGGKVKATETLEAGLFRELEEEIGGQVRTAYPTAIF